MAEIKTIGDLRQLIQGKPDSMPVYGDVDSEVFDSESLITGIVVEAVYETRCNDEEHLYFTIDVR